VRTGLLYLKEGSCLGFKPQYKKVFKSSWLKSSNFFQGPSGTFTYPSSSLPLGHSLADQTLLCPKAFARTSANRVWALTLFPSHHPAVPVQLEWEKPVPKEESPILHLGAKPDVLPRGSGCPSAKTGDPNASFGPKPMAARQTAPRAGSPHPESTRGRERRQAGSETWVNQRQLLGRFLCTTRVFLLTGNWVLIRKLNKPHSGSPATSTRQSYSTSNCWFRAIV